jgi:putative hemolysin
MTSILVIQLIALGLLLVVSAFFSSSEVALFALNPLQIRRLDRTHPKAAERIRVILNPPTRFLSTILIGNTVVNVVISILGFAVAMQLYPVHGEWIAIAAMTLLLLVFGEVAPKRIAFMWPERTAVVYAGPLLLIMRVLTPFRLGLEKITEHFQHAFQSRGRTLSEEEFESVVEMSGERGVLHAGERDMLKSIMRLEDLQARDVMTPRVDLIGCNLNDDRADLEAVAKRSKVRQLVLYRDSIDQVEGLLDVRRFLLDKAHRAQPAWLPPIYVPEACPLDRLLTRFLREQRRAAIVVDEYGGTAGLIKRGDILEEITGDIDDEHAEHKLLFDPAGSDRWLLDGQVSLEEINQKLDMRLEAEGADRLAGWLAARLERLPRPGDVVTHQGCRAVVQQMRKHRVTQVIVERLPATDDEEVP